MTNVERCSKRETLQGIARFMQTVIVCSHVKYVQRPLAELSGQHLISLSRQPTTKSNISLNPIPITIMWTSLRSSTGRLSCHVLPTSTVTICSFNSVVPIDTMFLSNVSSICLPHMRHIHTGCIYLIFLHCAFSNVSSNCLILKMHNYISCICLLKSPDCI